MQHSHAEDKLKPRENVNKCHVTDDVVCCHVLWTGMSDILTLMIGGLAMFGNVTSSTTIFVTNG